LEDPAFQKLVSLDPPKKDVFVKQKLESVAQRMEKDGYFTLDPTDMGVSVDCKVIKTSSIARGVAQLVQYGYPPSFILMFDEIWTLISRQEVFSKLTCGNSCNMDILAWLVDPNGEDPSGFAPHRDRQPEIGKSPSTSFHDNGCPKYNTCWMALTDACPDNSCLYVLPRG
jgi:hypothetical protein